MRLPSCRAVCQALNFSLVAPALVLTDDAVVVFVSARYRAASLTREKIKKKKNAQLVAFRGELAEKPGRNKSGGRVIRTHLAPPCTVWPSVKGSSLSSDKPTKYSPLSELSGCCNLLEVNVSCIKKKDPLAFVLHLGDNRPCSLTYTL